MRPFRNGKGSYDHGASEVPEVCEEPPGTRAITSAVPLPITIWIFPKMCCTLRTRDLIRYRWSRLSAPDTEAYSLNAGGPSDDPGAV